MITRVLDALLDNAVKFTKSPDAVITLEVVWRPAPASRSLQFVVTDTGVGMTPEQLELVRIPFAQVDGATTRRFGGAGLGLTLARQLLSIVGSELQITSKERQGTRVTFALSATAASAALLVSAV
ncbi:MAG TPA: ATP-binding protein [Opitutaceae bacterium]